jgi:hypothetical protein
VWRGSYSPPIADSAGEYSDEDHRSFGLMIAALTACTTTPGKRLPREAANAMTGSAETLTAISALSIEGSGPGMTSFKREMNFRRGQFRQEETRGSQREVSGLDGKAPYRISPEGIAEKISDEQAKIIRAEMYHHPIPFLLAVFSRDVPACNTRTEGALEAVDITVNGITHTMYVNTSTKLPAKIVSHINAENGTNVVMETLFDQYVDVHGYKLPSEMTRKLDNQATFQIHLDVQHAGAATAELPIPGGVKPVVDLSH